MARPLDHGPVVKEKEKRRRRHPANQDLTGPVSSKRSEIAVG